MPRTRQTDILMFNSQNLGAMIVKKDPEVKSWEDNMYNIQSMAIEEEYGFGIINEGQAIAVARNVKVRPNEFVMPARTVFDRSMAVGCWFISGMFLPEIPRFSLSLRCATLALCCQTAPRTTL